MTGSGRALETSRLESAALQSLRDAVAGGPVEIAGLGVDVVSLDRFGSLLRRSGSRIERLVFTEAESRRCSSMTDPAKSLAGTFAIKEAVYKALAIRWAGAFSWKMIEVSHDARRPGAQLTGLAREAFASSGGKSLAVSVSYTRDHAVAVAVLR